MKTVLLTLPDDLKAKLDAKRKQGFTLVGFIRQVLTEALQDVKVPRRRRAT